MPAVHQHLSTNHTPSHVHTRDIYINTYIAVIKTRTHRFVPTCKNLWESSHDKPISKCTLQTAATTPPRRSNAREVDHRQQYLVQATIRCLNLDGRGKIKLKKTSVYSKKPGVSTYTSERVRARDTVPTPSSQALNINSPKCFDR